MRIATWNINGISARLEGAVQWVERGPARRRLPAGDQVESTRPSRAEAFEDLGYNVAVHGQKSFNGVAILSKLPFDEIVRRGLPGDDERRAGPLHRGACSRAPAARCASASLYLPNGNPIGTEKFAYKLAWMERLRGPRRDAAGARGAVRAGRRLQRHPRADRRHAPRALGRATRSSSRRRARAFRALLNLGPDRRLPRLHRRAPATTPSGTTRPAPGSGTTASASTTSCSRRRPPTGSWRAGIDKRTRSWDKPSDHVPVMIELDV